MTIYKDLVTFLYKHHQRAVDLDRKPYDERTRTKWVEEAGKELKVLNDKLVSTLTSKRS